MRRIHVDFNSRTIDGSRVIINKHGQPEFTEFISGEEVIIYEPHDIEVKAILEKVILDDGREVWFAIADWSTKIYIR